MPRGKIQVVSKVEIENAKKLISELPDPVKVSFTVAEAIEDIKAEIKSMLDKGHNVETVVQTLSKSGISISASKFKTIWSKLYPQRKRRGRKSKPLDGTAGADSEEGSSTTSAGTEAPETDA